jgi:ATP phosphoribosyltransferase regulatory subunit
VGEFTQAGVELMGVSSPEADAEVVALAVESLRAAGLSAFRIDIGQVDFLRGILEESGWDIELRKEMVRNIVAHDFVSAEKIALSNPVREPARRFFSDLTYWTGGPDRLAEAARCTRHPLALKAAEHLSEVYGILRNKNLAEYMLFDLSMAGHFDYYTGMVFRGYTRGTGYAVVDGGRYDNLLAAYGCPSPAVGFAIRLDGVLEALDAQESEPPSVNESCIDVPF